MARRYVIAASNDGRGARSCAVGRLLGPGHGLAKLSDLVRAVQINAIRHHVTVASDPADSRG